MLLQPLDSALLATCSRVPCESFGQWWAALQPDTWQPYEPISIHRRLRFFQDRYSTRPLVKHTASYETKHFWLRRNWQRHQCFSAWFSVWDGMTLKCTWGSDCDEWKRPGWIEAISNLLNWPCVGLSPPHSLSLSVCTCGSVYNHVNRNRKWSFPKRWTGVTEEMQTQLRVNLGIIYLGWDSSVWLCMSVSCRCYRRGL